MWGKAAAKKKGCGRWIAYCSVLVLPLAQHVLHGALLLAVQLFHVAEALLREMQLFLWCGCVVVVLCCEGVCAREDSGPYFAVTVPLLELIKLGVALLFEELRRVGGV